MIYSSYAYLSVFYPVGGHGPFRPLGDQLCPPENYDFCALYYAFAPPEIGLRPPGDSFRPPGEKNLDKTLLSIVVSFIGNKENINIIGLQH